MKLDLMRDSSVCNKSSLSISHVNTNIKKDQKSLHLLLLSLDISVLCCKRHYVVCLGTCVALFKCANTVN